MKNKSTMCLLALWMACSGCLAQAPQRNNGPAGQQAPRRQVNVVSPVVHPDNTVTFSYLAPAAKEVKVNVQFAGTHPLTKDENGVWSITLGPAAPDIYPYCFIVDGTTVMDPLNPEWFPNEKFKNSLVDIRGEQPLIHSLQNVPHGQVNYDYYFSNTLGDYAQVLVYTPPFYDQQPKKKYPVFYLISGTTDTEETYFKVGKLNLILDNLLAQGAAKEMIVVMPYGNPTYKLTPAQREKLAGRDAFSEDLLNDLMPYIDRTYRTVPDADHRGIGGFSRGGGQALRNGLSHLDLFSNVCSYSSYIGVEEFNQRYKSLYENPQQTNQKLHLLWLGVGDDDFLVDGATDFMDLMDKYQLKNVRLISKGKFGHTWMNAKFFLDHSLRLLFQDKPSQSNAL